MTSYDYIIMIIDDSCIIWFHLDLYADFNFLNEQNFSGSLDRVD